MSQLGSDDNLLPLKETDLFGDSRTVYLVPCYGKGSKLEDIVWKMTTILSWLQSVEFG